jgi:hypothetical protein
MAAHYANLESSQRERHMDLPKLRQETETKLRQACDEPRAQNNLQGFIEALPWAQRDTPYTKAVKLSHALNAALAAESSKLLSH